MTEPSSNMSIGEYLMTVATAVAQRSKCRRKVGCVLADKKGRILSTGYNGYPSGMKNCNESTCTNPPGVSGTCHALHAEINAILWVRNPEDIYYIAVTRLPCINCAMALLNTSGKVLIYNEDNSYPTVTSYLEQKLLLERVEA